jgi:hypothetical protein
LTEEEEDGFEEDKRHGWLADAAEATGCCLVEAAAGAIVFLGLIVAPLYLFVR